jgi:hypothetical protein
MLKLSNYLKNILQKSCNKNHNMYKADIHANDEYTLGIAVSFGRILIMVNDVSFLF